MWPERGCQKAKPSPPSQLSNQLLPRPAGALGSERGRDTASYTALGREGDLPSGPQGSQHLEPPWAPALMPQIECQSQGLRTRETGAQEGPEGPLVQDQCPGSRGWRPPACPLRPLGSVDQQSAWPWPEKGLTGGYFPPPFSGNATVRRRVWIASDFLLPLTDGETEAQGGKVCPPRLLTPRCLPLSCITLISGPFPSAGCPWWDPHPLHMRSRVGNWTGARSPPPLSSLTPGAPCCQGLGAEVALEAQVQTGGFCQGFGP